MNTLPDDACDYWHEMQFLAADHAFDAGEFSNAFSAGGPENEPCGKCTTCYERSRDSSCEWCGHGEAKFVGKDRAMICAGCTDHESFARFETIAKAARWSDVIRLLDEDKADTAIVVARAIVLGGPANIYADPNATPTLARLRPILIARGYQ